MLAVPPPDAIICPDECVCLCILSPLQQELTWGAVLIRPGRGSLGLIASDDYGMELAAIRPGGHLC